MEVPIAHAGCPPTLNAARAPRSRSRSTRVLIWVGFIVLMLALPLSAYAWTRYQYFSGTSGYGYYYGEETGGYQPREYNEAFHSTDDEWQVTYFLSNDTSILAAAASYSDPIDLGSTTTSVYSACQVIDPESTGQPFDCATTVP